MRIHRALTHRPVRWTTLLGLLLAPLLVAGGVMWGTWSTGERLHTVQAAIVNLDEGAELNGKTVPLGRQLSAALVDSDRERNLSWVMADEEHADLGLESGRYAAVVTIPDDFSASATSWSANDDTAHQATIGIATSPRGGLTDTAVAQIVATAAVESFNADLTKMYLDNIYVGFNKQGEAFQTVADGTADLADGTHQLSDGLTTMADKGTTLADGGTKLADGTAELSTGLSTMATKGKTLRTGTGKLADGLSTYADGVGKLDDKTTALPKNTRQLADGVDAYVTGTQSLIGQVEQMGSLASKTDNADQLAAASHNLANGLATYQTKMEDLATGVSPQTGEQIACPDQVRQAYADAGCAGFYAGLKAGGTAAASGLADQGDNPGLVTVATRVDSGVSTLTTTLGSLPKPEPDQAEKLTKLKGAGDKLVTGTDALADNMTGLSDGIGKLADGADKLAVGASELDKGVTAYTQGLETVATNVATLADGTATYTQGVTTYTQGVGTIADGGAKLDKGVSTLADKLADNADTMPNYTKTERKALSSAVAEPVTPTDPDSLAAPTVAWASLLLVAALWLGAVLTFTLLPAVRPDTLLRTKRTWRVVAASMGMPLALAATQAVLLAGVASAVLPLSGVELTKLLALLLHAGLPFYAVTQGLVGWLRGLGRVIAIAMGGALVVGAATQAAPRPFDTVRGLSPHAPALDGVRSVLAGSSMTSFVLALMGWLLLGLLLTALAVTRARRVQAAHVLPTR